MDGGDRGAMLESGVALVLLVAMTHKDGG